MFPIYNGNHSQSHAINFSTRFNFDLIAFRFNCFHLFRFVFRFLHNFASSFLKRTFSPIWILYSLSIRHISTTFNCLQSILLCTCWQSFKWHQFHWIVFSSFFESRRVFVSIAFHVWCGRRFDVAFHHQLRSWVSLWPISMSLRTFSTPTHLLIHTMIHSFQSRHVFFHREF